jgi:MFS family permease
VSHVCVTAYFLLTPESLLPGLRDVFANWIVVAAAFSACMGGLLFGFDQGILSIVLTMKQFLNQFPETDPAQDSGAAFNKGIMTGLLELGAFLGAIQAGYLADRYSRKKAIGESQ